MQIVRTGLYGKIEVRKADSSMPGQWFATVLDANEVGMLMVQHVFIARSASAALKLAQKEVSK
jgi:hypothetical protein